MGGGGSYYDRDVTDKSRRGDKGFSDIAEEKMSKTKVDKTVLPYGRKLICAAKSPVVYAFDVTGSMDNLPKIIFDKMPMMAGQLIEHGYFEDLMISLSAVGDILSDQAPLQVCDFSVIKNLDEWLQRIWLEGNGGGQAHESYELIAYFYARMCEMPNAKTPVFLFTGDEGFRENLPADTLRKYFGGGLENTDAKSIFQELKKKFKGNVFLIHRRYHQDDQDREIVAQWENVLDREKIIKLSNDLAIADVTLGVFVIITGKRTLEEYLSDMKTRGQTAERIAEVRESLRELAATVKLVRPEKSDKKIAETATTPSETKNKKPGRI